MTVVSPDRAQRGYLLGEDEGEASWLLGMLEAPPDMARLIPIGSRNGIEILGPPGPPPAH